MQRLKKVWYDPAPVVQNPASDRFLKQGWQYK